MELKASQGTAADPGGGKGAMAPLSLLKLVFKKMAAIRCALYFMFLVPPPPLTFLDPMLGNVHHVHKNCSTNKALQIKRTCHRLLKRNIFIGHFSLLLCVKFILEFNKGYSGVPFRFSSAISPVCYCHSKHVPLIQLLYYRSPTVLTVKA